MLQRENRARLREIQRHSGGEDHAVTDLARTSQGLPAA